MRRFFGWLGLAFVGFGWMFAPGPAHAVITRLTPLREVLRSEEFIFRVKVEKLDRAKTTTVLAVEEEWKGKTPFRKLAVDLTADSQGQREHDTERLLKRLASDLPLVVFVSKRGMRYMAFAYTEGTWFQFVSPGGDDPAAVRWHLTHCEPYLRRTFKGSTAEFMRVIKDALSGKAAPPDPDPKEPPGLGPEIKTTPRSSLPVDRAGGRPLVAVIPTFVILGPLALLASLGLGAVALFLRRWRLPILVVSLDSTLYILHSLCRGYLGESWWASRAAAGCAAR